MRVFGHPYHPAYHFFGLVLPEGVTGQDCREGPVFLAVMSVRCAGLSFLATAAGRHAG